jgi:Polyketide cyclase / dehydrase and lipid transport
MEYRFLTTWLLHADLHAVFDAIHDTEAWPQWWPGVRRVVSRGGGDADGVGRRFEIVWRSFLPYDLAFETHVTRVQRPRVMEGAATGELVGTGRWRLYDDPDGLVAVLYEWNVATTKPWMNALGPLGRPVFRFNHDYVMRAGGRGLARLLDAELIAGT